MKSASFRTFEKDSVVFEIPSGICDENNLKNWMKSVEEASTGLKRWVLMCIPDSSVVITPEAANKLVSRLGVLKSKGCQRICILMTTTAAKIVTHAIQPEQTGGFIVASESIEKLCQEAEYALGDGHLLSM